MKTNMSVININSQNKKKEIEENPLKTGVLRQRVCSY